MNKLHDVQDKKWWVKQGEKKEIEFVERIAPSLGLISRINPQKRSNPYAPDLVVNNHLADLKYREIPFFTSYNKYGIPPQYAVTFNRKDYTNYYFNYPDVVIYFWVDWRTTTHKLGKSFYAVRPMTGVWRGDFGKLVELVQSKMARLHYYANRQNDMLGNARSSYVLDLRDMDELFVKFP